MPTNILVAKLLNQYFKNGKVHPSYKDTVKIMKQIRDHADGNFPGEIISKVRPSEPLKVAEYRKEIFEAITKETISRIVTCLSKIRRSPDWAILYDPKKFAAGIIPDEQPDKYFEENYPNNFKSLTNWMFAVCMKFYLTDANGVCLVMPLNPEVAQAEIKNEYLKPYPYLFHSDLVLDYQENDYCILKSEDKSTYILPDGTVKDDGDIFFVVTTEVIIRYEQTDDKGTLTPVLEYYHQLGYMPAFKMGGIFKKAMKNTFIYESRIQPIVPRLNKAIREDNDLDISVVRHLFPEKWEYTSFDCPSCNGVGKITSMSAGVGGIASVTKCNDCGGAGKMVSSPLQTHMIKPAGVGEQQVPNPPAGYIIKDMKIVELQAQRVEEHIYKALCAINLDNLAKIPTNQSGVAKAYDKDDTNDFVHGIAEDTVGIMDRIEYISFDYRYSVIVPDPVKRRAAIPEINVPEKFDLFSVETLMDEYTKARNANINPLVILQMEKEIITKRFSTNPEIRNMLIAISALDPFGGMNNADKILNFTNKLATQEDMVISANVISFVARAKFENDDFYSNPTKWTFDKQRALMVTYAQEKIKEMSAAEQVRLMIQNDPANQNPAGGPGGPGPGKPAAKPPVPAN